MSVPFLLDAESGRVWRYEDAKNDSATNGCGLPDDEPENNPDSQAHGIENRAKNNFCAWQNVTTPALVTRLSFDKLDATRPPVTCCGRDTLPTVAERHTLQTPFYTTTEGAMLGEGSYVEFVRSSWKATSARGERELSGHQERRARHPSRVGHDEADLLNLNTVGATECTSVTAELSPHRRPIEWDVLGRITGTPAKDKLTKAQTKLKDEACSDHALPRPALLRCVAKSVRERSTDVGQSRAAIALGDSSHVRIDVCKNTTLASCKVDDAVWTPLSDFLAGGSDEGRPSTDVIPPL